LTIGEIQCRQELSHIPVHEVIFSTIDKPKLLSQVYFRSKYSDIKIRINFWRLTFSLFSSLSSLILPWTGNPHEVTGKTSGLWRFITRCYFVLAFCIAFGYRTEYPRSTRVLNNWWLLPWCFCGGWVACWGTLSFSVVLLLLSVLFAVSSTLMP
jgi:hypothetical protein